MSGVIALRRMPADLKDVLLHPRRFVQSWRGYGPSLPSSLIVLACCALAAVVLFGAYNLAFGSMQENVTKAVGLAVAPTADRGTGPSSAPKLKSIEGRLSIGAGISFPDNLPLGQPQTALFYFGAAAVTFEGVTPSSPIVMPMGLVLIAAYALLTVLCSHPAARHFSGRGGAGEVMLLAVAFYSYLAAFASGLAVVLAVLLLHVIALKGWAFLVAWLLGGGLVVVVAGVRGLVLVLAEYYQLKKRRILLALLVSWALSSILGIGVIFSTAYGAFGVASLLGVAA